jgi:ABC-type glycerol-3-phosphate transport system substrate-binding protein
MLIPRSKERIMKLNLIQLLMALGVAATVAACGGGTETTAPLEEDTTVEDMAPMDGAEPMDEMDEADSPEEAEGGEG